MTTPPTTAAIAATYDGLTYGWKAHEPAHPARLSAAGRLHGLDTAAVAECRVLELGCAEAGNLLLLAELYPRSSFVGVELSARQVALARDRIAAIGLGNVAVHQLDLVEIDGTFGEFDYVIAHGVYSWVQPHVRDRLMAVCHDRLSQRGIAYVSYNTTPGWHVDAVLRDIVLDRLAPAATEDHAELARRVAAARDIAREVAAQADPSSPYGALLGGCATMMLQKDDAYIAHEFLELVNEAVSVTEFTAHAERFGLYAVDDMVARLGTPAGDLKAAQQADRILGTGFRAAALSARRPTHHPPPPERLATWYVSAEVRADGPVEVGDASAARFVHRTGISASTSSPLTKAMLVELSARWPWSTQVAHLARQLGAPTPAVLGELLTLRSHGMVELTEEDFPAGRGDDPRPRIARTVRAMAQAGTTVHNSRHTHFEFDDFVRVVMQWFDGSRTVEEVAGELVDAASAGRLELCDDEGRPLRGPELAEMAEQTVPDVLGYLASCGLLMPPDH